MDMTNSLRVWQGGVVGIVRAELEIAKNLKANYPELRISVINDAYGFSEIDTKKLDWLWNSDSVADAYLKEMGRDKKEIKVSGKEERDYLKELSGLQSAYAYSDSRLERLKRAGFLIREKSPKLVRPLESVVGYTVYLPVKMGSVVRMLYKKKKQKRIEKLKVKKLPFEEHPFRHPYQEGDVVFSAGWFGSNKEQAFSKVKAKLNNFYLVYLVYDLVLIKKGTAQLFEGNYYFQRYFEWITNNCDFILYGGRTAMEDSFSYQKEKGLRVVPGDYIKFGADIKRDRSSKDKTKILEKYNISEPYLITVGSVDAKKNQQILYKAYSILADRKRIDTIPELFIIGGEYGCPNLVDAIKLDPKIKGKIRIIHPNDEELDILYQNCLFVTLPSLYEGWSLTLPEALSYCKLCITSDVPPLKEVGGIFAEYVDPNDPVKWADAIENYTQDRKLIRKKENLIKTNWKKITWDNCAKEILDKLEQIKEKGNSCTIYYDLSTAWYLSFFHTNVSGILRTQLILARYLARLLPQMHFFALSPVKGYIEIDRDMIADILGTQNIELAYQQSSNSLICAEGNIRSSVTQMDSNSKEALWMLISILPHKMQHLLLDGRYKEAEKSSDSYKTVKKGLKLPFRENDIVFSTGSGYELPVYEELLSIKKELNFKFFQLIYDFTPILLPQVHKKETVDYYDPFLKYSYKLSDGIFYGGMTARKDGEIYQKQHDLSLKPGYALKFGSNIVTYKKRTKAEEKEELKKLNIIGPYIIAVGSIEIRKNHETLYQAYLKIIEKEGEKSRLPQLIFVGYPGWKTEEFVNVIYRDERIWGKILLCTPSDEQLDILYRNCLFTVLASQYEGWSLTLPESLNYGKFCIASKVEPLIEIGQDFIDYVHPWDVVGWADKIRFYFSHPEELKKKEKRIAEEWHAITWEECAKQVAESLICIMEDRNESGK